MNQCLFTKISLVFKLFVVGCSLSLLLNNPARGQECTKEEIQTHIARLDLSFPNRSKSPISPNNPVIKCGSESIKVLATIVQDRKAKYSVRVNAAIVLGRIGADSEYAINALTTVVQSKKEWNLYFLQSVAFALGQTESNSETVINALSTAIDNALASNNAFSHHHPSYWISMRAVEALYKIGTDSETVANAISRHVRGFKNLNPHPRVSDFAIQALGHRGWRSTEAINTLIDVVNDKDASDRTRKDAANALFKLGSKLEANKEQLSTKKLQNLINKLEKALEIFKSYSEEQKEKIRKKLSEENKIHMRLQQEAYDQERQDLERTISLLQLEIQSRWREQIIKWVGSGWLIHLGFWIILILFYPKYPWLQAIFFWNPKVRKIIGLWYMDLAFTWIPFLRSKLFAPFQESLLSDADLENFDSTAYFANSLVEFEKEGKKSIQPIREAIPEIQGQIILEGESGLGKSMFLRHLVQNCHRIVVYLPARKCTQGVMKAIQDKLHGYVKEDPNFLKNLIYSGAIDISIDGLNEVTPDTRAKITSFVESFFKGNIIMATQPLEWISPSTAKIYILQPLKEKQIEQFLISRSSILPSDSLVVGPDYEQACKDYLKTPLNQQQSTEEEFAVRRMLSNPVELTIVALILARGEKPDLLNLQEQQYKIMAADYKRMYPAKTFPLKVFSETVYQMRLNDEATIVPEKGLEELQCMERHKMVLSRQGLDVTGKTQKKWYFRHDKIEDFFVVQTFLGEENEEKLLEHISDPRFRGVYFLLATMMPVDAAKKLRETLINYAADTKDHLVSDTFIQLFRPRQRQ